MIPTRQTNRLTMQRRKSLSQHSCTQHVCFALYIVLTVFSTLFDWQDLKFGYVP